LSDWVIVNNLQALSDLHLSELHLSDLHLDDLQSRRSSISTIFNLDDLQSRRS